MKYWIIKFAPFRVSWEHILATGRFEIYSVRNPQARNNLVAMQRGDLAYYYHSQEGKCIMGIMQVTIEAHQDFTTTDKRWKSVTFEPIESLTNIVSLTDIKSHPALQKLALIRQPRLAVSEISLDEFETIYSLST